MKTSVIRIKSTEKNEFILAGKKKKETFLWLPLFQLNSFFTKTFPFGLKGPFSENAPTPREEHPGPTPTQGEKEKEKKSKQFY